MKIEQVKKLKPLQRLIYWIDQRENNLRYGKDVLCTPPPWTDDEILQRYRFCNVRRMDDKVSKWLLYNWYIKHKNHENIVLACTVGRLFNLPTTLEALGFPTTSQPGSYVARIPMKLATLRPPIFNGAYIVSTNGVKMDKVQYLVQKVLMPMVDNPPKIDTDYMEHTVVRLTEYNGIGSFIAGQITADLRWAMSGKWFDRNSWAPIGPGSRRGMNRIHERPLTTSISDKQFTEELQDLMQLLYPALHSALYDKMEAIDFQNCLCEYDKYCRTLLGEGRPKQRYPGV